MTRKPTTPKTEPKKRPARPTKLLVYRGVYRGQKKVLSRWMEVTEAEYQAGLMPAKSDDRGALYDRKAGRGYSVGHVVRVEYDAASPSSIYTGTMRYLGQWPNKADRIAWAAEAAQQEMLIDIDTARKAAGDPLVEQLRPVVLAYRRAVGANRTRLLAAVVAIITGGA